jgi:hypothetical protein
MSVKLSQIKRYIDDHVVILNSEQLSFTEVLRQLHYLLKNLFDTEKKQGPEAPVYVPGYS